MKGLPSGRCPECGRKFDRGDPGTYADLPGRRVYEMPTMYRVSLAWPIVTIAWLHIVWAVDQYTPESWPTRYGAVPKHGVVNLLQLAAVLALAMMPFVLVIMVASLLSRSEGDWRFVRAKLPLVLVCWGVLVVAILVDPAGARVWLLR